MSKDKKKKTGAGRQQDEEPIGTGIIEEVLPEATVASPLETEEATSEDLESMYIPDISFVPQYQEASSTEYLVAQDTMEMSDAPPDAMEISDASRERGETRDASGDAPEEEEDGEEAEDEPESQMRYESPSAEFIGETEGSREGAAPAYIIEELPKEDKSSFYFEDWAGPAMVEPRLKAIQMVIKDHLMKGAPVEFPMYARDEDMVEISRLINQVIDRHRVSRQVEAGAPVDGRIHEIGESLEKVTRGYLKVRVPYAEDPDAIGSLAKMINDMVEAYDKLKENTKGSFMMDMIEELQSTRDYLLERVNHILRAIEEFSGGKTNARVDVSKTDDPIGMLSVGINEMIERLNEREQEMKGISQELASGLASNFEVLKKFSMEGNLTVRAPENPNNQMLQSLADVVNTTLERFREIVKEFSEGITQIESTAGDILRSTEEQSAGLAHQSAGMSESTATITELSLTSAQIADHANLAMKLATQSIEKANQGQNAVNAALTGTDEISASTESAAKKILSLGEKSQAIGEVVDIIDDIAEQTNLLALNAAIEAARAGDAGRGFAVVASEIRKLAENVVGSTKEIKTLIKEIQNHTNASVMAMEEVTKKVNRGSSLSRDVRESLGEIFKMVEETAEAAKQITLTTQQQKSASEQIVKTMEEMTVVARDSATNIQQVTTSVKDLNMLSEKMKQLMDQFKL